jgi:hypothetical protein
MKKKRNEFFFALTPKFLLHYNKLYYVFSDIRVMMHA